MIECILGIINNSVNVILEKVTSHGNGLVNRFVPVKINTEHNELTHFATMLPILSPYAPEQY